MLIANHEMGDLAELAKETAIFFFFVGLGGIRCAALAFCDGAGLKHGRVQEECPNPLIHFRPVVVFRGFADGLADGNAEFCSNRCLGIGKRRRLDAVVEVVKGDLRGL
jgi:hypothetical protein